MWKSIFKIFDLLLDIGLLVAMLYATWHGEWAQAALFGVLILMNDAKKLRTVTVRITRP